MSILDARLELSSAQALTASADATNVIDLTQTARQVGAGKPLFVHFNVTVAADFSTTDETYAFGVATGASSTLGTVLVTRTILAATLVAGFNFSIQVPQDGMLRYLGVEYVLAGTTPSVTVDAYVSDQEAYSWISTADAI
mgnify:FL=1|tara:strand:- start:16 stop:435 length:420 start_codon:yes stop_codon:yes gene_type:complete